MTVDLQDEHTGGRTETVRLCRWLRPSVLGDRHTVDFISSLAVLEKSKHVVAPALHPGKVLGKVNNSDSENTLIQSQFFLWVFVFLLWPELQLHATAVQGQSTKVHRGPPRSTEVH